ncbi:hypothetical protein [Calothrix sp. CCY 0018]|uniref:hypothetical protein n=1 Tax=Calothrix sp. CCY 0018 TaxID=3103864 RepID=UPI0039C6C09E
MKHINAVAQDLQTTPEIISKVCQKLELKINKDDTLKPDVEQQLIQLKEVAAVENMSLEEAADYLLEMRNERSSNEHTFDGNEYIQQRFGVNPEESESNSFVNVLHSDVERGKQLATLRHKVVLETSTLMLEDMLFNGVQEPTTELEENQNRVYKRIDDDFFGKVNWGEEPHSESGKQSQQLKSRPKTKSLPGK